MHKALEVIASESDLADYMHQLDGKEVGKLTASQLRGRNRYILEMRSGLNDDLEGMTLEQLGSVVSITREGVRIIYRRIAPIFMEELARLAGGLENLPIDIAL
jgi:DNA-directed RNA polymerase sigma subunit (sigma70/sigma32)